MGDEKQTADSGKLETMLAARKMTSDEYQAFCFLSGRGNEAEVIRTMKGLRLAAYFGENAAREAFRRILSSDSPLHPAIRQALARAASPWPDDGPLRLEMVFVRRAGRGRPSKRAIEGAYSQIRLAIRVQCLVAASGGGRGATSEAVRAVAAEEKITETEVWTALRATERGEKQVAK